MPLCSAVGFATLGNYRIVANAAARPSGGALYTGLRIFQADTFQELEWDGTNWIVMSEPAQTWANPFAGITGGSPTFIGAYHRSDGWCDFSGTLTFGSSPSAMSGPNFIVPFTAGGLHLGQCTVALTDNGVANYPGISERGINAIAIYATNVGSTYIQFTSPTTTVPFTWAAGDYIEIAGRYQMASRYS